MVVLVGYSIAGIHIVVVVHSGRMWVVVSLQVRVAIVAGQVVTRGELGSLSRTLNESGTVFKVCDYELPELCIVLCLCHIYVR